MIFLPVLAAFQFFPSVLHFNRKFGNRNGAFIGREYQNLIRMFGVRTSVKKGDDT